MKLVIIESPFAGGDFDEQQANIQYARDCLQDSLYRGEAPIASHILYTQPSVLCDDIPSERDMGINAGLAWLKVAELSAVYTDKGVSAGMRQGISAAQKAGVRVELRKIGVKLDKQPLSA